MSIIINEMNDSNHNYNRGAGSYRLKEILNSQIIHIPPDPFSATKEQVNSPPPSQNCHLLPTMLKVAPGPRGGSGSGQVGFGCPTWVLRRSHVLSFNS